MSNDVSLTEIDRKLDILVRLMAYQIVGKMTLTDGAPLLRRLGLTPSEIAAVYGSNQNVVNVRLAEAKKKNKKG